MHLCQLRRVVGQIIGPGTLSPAPSTENHNLREMLVDPVFDWDTVVAEASNEFVTTTLCLQLQRKGLFEKLEPELRDYFETMLCLNRQRNHEHLAELARIIKLFNKHDIKTMVVKGMAHIILGLYDDPGERLVGDIDLIIPDARIQDAADILREVGYRQIYEDLRPSDLPADHYHHPALIHVDTAIKVELHRHILKRPLRKAAPTIDVWRRAEQHQLDGYPVLVPGPEDLVIHNIVHSQLSDLGFHYANFSMRDAYDLLLLLGCYRDRLDPTSLASRMMKDIGPGCSAFYTRCSHELMGVSFSLPLTWPLSAELTYRRWLWHERGRYLWMRSVLERAMVFRQMLLAVFKPYGRRRLLKKLNDWCRPHEKVQP